MFVVSPASTVPLQLPWIFTPNGLFAIIIVFAIVMFTLILLRTLIERFFGMFRPRRRKFDFSVYTARGNLLTPAEETFLIALEQAIGNVWRIAMKVRLGDLVAAPGDQQSARNRVNQKHVDFVLCMRSPVRPMLVIELDDASHNRPDRQARDAFVDNTLASAGIPILHVKCQRQYDPRQLQAEIRARVG